MLPDFRNFGRLTMSAHDLKSISDVTGAFAALQPAAGTARTGNLAPDGGKNTPAPARQEPDIEALATKLNLQSQPSARDLRFEVNMDSGNSVIQVLDRETGEIIREIPPEKAEISLSASGEVNIRLYDGQA